MSLETVSRWKAMGHDELSHGRAAMLLSYADPADAACRGVPVALEALSRPGKGASVGLAVMASLQHVSMKIAMGANYSDSAHKRSNSVAYRIAIGWTFQSTRAFSALCSIAEAVKLKEPVSTETESMTMNLW